MFHKYLIISLLVPSFLLTNELGLEDKGIQIKIIDTKGKTVYTVVKRDIPEECKKLPSNNTMLWTGNYANIKVPEACKSTYVHALGGHIYPIEIDEDIDTYGELEVLAFMKQMQTDDSMMLIDGRKQDWYDYRTIPGAINMPFHHFKERESFEFEFEHALRMLGVKIQMDETLDFSQVKTIVVFCNGPWCSQSVAMIEALVEIGYPVEKISWYRGGMQTWLAAGMTSTRE